MGQIMRIVLYCSLFTLLSTGQFSAVAQDLAQWTFERVSGPVAPVAKLVYVSLAELDPDVRISHSDRFLKVRIGSEFSEALLLQRLSLATGGAFRSVLPVEIESAPAAQNISTYNSIGKESHVDLAAMLAERTDLLLELGLPASTPNASETERETHHSQVKTWLEGHPEQRPILLHLLTNEGNDE